MTDDGIIDKLQTKFPHMHFKIINNFGNVIDIGIAEKVSVGKITELCSFAANNSQKAEFFGMSWYLVLRLYL